MRKAALLLLLAIACRPAEAGPAHGPRHGPAILYRHSVGSSASLIQLDHDAGGNFMVLNLGQSLACRALDDGGLSATQPYDNVQADAGGFVELIETIPGGESPMPGTANQISSLQADQTELIAVQGCASATSIADMMDGGIPFNALMVQTGQSVTANSRASVGFATFAHGEEDMILGTTAAQYAARLASYRTELQQGLRMNGSLPADRDLVMLLDQEAGWTDYADGDQILEGQWLAVEADPLHFVLAQPKYQMTYIDGVHTNSASRRWTGQHLGKVAASMFYGGQRWEEFRPRRCLASGTTVSCYMVVPCLRYVGGSRCSASPPIEIDTTVVSDRTYPGRGIWYGMRLIDESTTGVAPYITGAPVIPATCAECASDEWRIDIPLDKAARTGSMIGIADTPNNGQLDGCRNADHGLGNGCNAASNIRDTDNTAAYAGGNSLNNWALFSRTAITGDTVAPSASDDAVVLARPWTNMWYPVSGCTASPGYTPFIDQVGAMDVAINSTTQDYDCGVTIANLDARGIGTAQIGQQVLWDTGACWNNNGTDVSWAGIADGEDLVISVTFLDTTGHAASTYLAGWAGGATEYWRLLYDASERVSLRFREAGMAAEYTGSTSLALATNTLHHCSIYLDTDASAGQPRTTIYCDANAPVVSALGANNPADFLTTGDFALGAIPNGAACLSPTPNIQFAFLGVAVGTANVGWFSEAAHRRDCRAMGVVACQ